MTSQDSVCLWSPEKKNMKAAPSATKHVSIIHTKTMKIETSKNVFKDGDF